MTTATQSRSTSSINVHRDTLAAGTAAQQPTPASPDSALLNEVLDRTAESLDHVAASYTAAIQDPASGRIRRAFLMAQGIERLRGLMTGQVLQAFANLAGSPLGFRTDKDDKGGYPADVLRECLIDALLRGLYPIGNEFNIIAGRSYVTKEGYARLVRETPGLTNLEMSIGIPAGRDGQTVVRVGASWNYGNERCQLTDAEGKPGKLFAVRVNAGMGADAIVGKATRKCLKAIYDQIHGSEFSGEDGEVGDSAGPARESTASTVAEKLTRTNGHTSTNGGGEGNATGKTAASAPPPPAEEKPPQSARGIAELLRGAIAETSNSADLQTLRKRIEACRNDLGDQTADDLVQMTWERRKDLAQQEPSVAATVQAGAAQAEQLEPAASGPKRGRKPALPREPGVEDEA